MQETSSLHHSLSLQATLLTELLSTALEPHLEAYGLTQSTFDLLLAVHASPRGASQASLARRLRVSAPSLSQAVHAAEQRGFLVASASTSDRRLRVIKLTAVGKRAVETAVSALNQLEMQVVEELEDREVKAAVIVLKRVNQRIAARLRSDLSE